MLNPGKSALCLGAGGTMGMFYQAGAIQGLEDSGIPVTDFGCYMGISGGGFDSFFLALGHDARRLRRDIDELLVVPSNLENKGLIERYSDRARRVFELASDGVKGVTKRDRGTTHDSLYSALIDYRLNHIIGEPVGFDDLKNDLYLITWDCRFPTIRVVATSRENARMLEGGDAETSFVYDKPVSDILAGTSSFIWPSGYLKDGGFSDPCPLDLAVRSGYDTVYIINPLVPIPGRVKGSKNGEQNWRNSYFSRFNERLKKHMEDFPDMRTVLIEPDINDGSDRCMRLFPMRMDYRRAYDCGYRDTIRELDLLI